MPAARKTSKSSNINTTANQIAQEEAKSQTLPCFSMISSGGCSYECYCKFLHDDRMLIDPKFGVKSGRLPKCHDRKNTTEKGFVLFYWPPMLGKLNAEGKQQYDLGQVGGKLASKNYSYLCLVSMWNHYLDNITDCNAQQFATEEEAAEEYNPITRRKRLPIFRELSMTSSQASPVAQESSPMQCLFSSNCSVDSNTTIEEFSDNESVCDFEKSFDKLPRLKSLGFCGDFNGKCDSVNVSNFSPFLY